MQQQQRRARFAAGILLALVTTVWWGAPAGSQAAAASDHGSRPLGTPTAAAPARCGTYRPPVTAPVVDPFRLPRGHYGPGNRGLEYATAPGVAVRSIGAGRVTFAGAVAGRLAVSVRHPDGRMSSLTGLAAVHVATGDLVARGTTVGTAAERTHLGIREDGRYVDPAPLLCTRRRRAVLVPGAP